MIVKKILTTSICGLSDRPGERPLWLLGPVESRPDRPAGLVAVDSPLIGDGTNDVQSMVPGRIDHSLVPGTAVVLDFDPNVMVLADCGPDSEGAAGQARAAVLGGVGREFGGAQDRVVCPRTVVEDCAKASSDSANVLSAAWIGDLGGALPECSRYWGVHGSSLRWSAVCNLERTLSPNTVQ
jgi:hypothetical protein